MASAVFNDIKRDQPNWRDQVAKYEPEKSIEWGDWNSNNKKRMSQIEFAEFLDEHIADIVGDGKRAPSAAEVLEAVTNLNDVRNVTFGSKVSLANGMASFVYTEKSPSGAVSEGHVSVPAEFLIGIPVFETAPPTPFEPSSVTGLTEAAESFGCGTNCNSCREYLPRRWKLTSRSWKNFSPENCPSIPAVNKKLLIHTALSIEGAKQKRIEKSVRFCFYGGQNDCSNEKGTDPQRIMGK